MEGGCINDTRSISYIICLSLIWTLAGFGLAWLGLVGLGFGLADLAGVLDLL